MASADTLALAMLLIVYLVTRLSYEPAVPLVDAYLTDWTVSRTAQVRGMWVAFD
jgi:hypothetical protein